MLEILALTLLIKRLIHLCFYALKFQEYLFPIFISIYFKKSFVLNIIFSSKVSKLYGMRKHSTFFIIAWISHWYVKQINTCFWMETNYTMNSLIANYLQRFHLNYSEYIYVMMWKWFVFTVFTLTKSKYI